MKVLCLAVILGLVLGFGPGVEGASAELGPAPVKAAAAILLKIVAFEKNLSEGGGDITLYVWGDAEMAAEFEKALGIAIGKAKLGQVLSGNAAPTSAPELLYVGSGADVAAAVEYSRASSILSITNAPALLAQGVSLGVGQGSDGKAVVILNPDASAKEGLDWNPAIMKVAKIVK